MFFHKIKVDVWSPRISIHNGEEEVFFRDVISQKDGLKMFGTPGHIGGLSLLFEFLDFVVGEVDSPEFVFEVVDKNFGFFLGALLMFFHGQENEIILSGSFVGG